MRDDLHARPTARKINFLDATEEEVADLVRSMMNQLAIMSSCLAMPTEERRRLKTNIDHFEAYLNCRLTN